MSLTTKRILTAGVAVLFCFSLARAAKFRFQEKEEAIYKACNDQLKAMGGNRNALKVKYFTPEIQMVSAATLAPGATGEVTVKGKFAPDTKFVFENDNFQVVKESLTATEYHASVSAAPGIGPQSATVVVITPVTGISARHDNAVSVCGKFEWNIQAANGWRVVGRSNGGKPCGAKGQPDTYDLSFFKNGEAKPFESRTATLNFSVYEQAAYRFSISQQAPPPPGQPSAGDIQALVQKMTDPKTSQAERDQLMTRLEKIQQQMQEQMQAAVKEMSDPNFAKKQQELQQKFGCESMELAITAGSLTGHMRCSQTVGAEVALTGSMKFLGQ